MGDWRDGMWREEYVLYSNGVGACGERIHCMARNGQAAPLGLMFCGVDDVDAMAHLAEQRIRENVVIERKPFFFLVLNLNFRRISRQSSSRRIGGSY